MTRCYLRESITRQYSAPAWGGVTGGGVSQIVCGGTCVTKRNQDATGVITNAILKGSPSISEAFKRAFAAHVEALKHLVAWSTTTWSQLPTAGQPPQTIRSLSDELKAARPLSCPEFNVTKTVASRPPRFQGRQRTPARPYRVRKWAAPAPRSCYRSHTEPGPAARTWKGFPLRRWLCGSASADQ